MRIKSVVVVIAICMLFLSGGVAENEPQKKVMSYIAVMDLKCDKSIEKQQCAALTEIVIDEIVKIGKYKVVDRANRDKILSEAGFQQSGCVDESCTIDMGRVMGVGKMVVGSITKLGTTYLLNLQLLNVETATVDITATEECKCDLDGLIGSIRKAARKLMGETYTPASSAAPSTPKPPPIDSTPPVPKITSKYIDTSKLAGSGLFPSYNPEKAMVIFYRSCWEGIYHKFWLYDDAKQIGEFKDNSYFYYETEPGTHKFVLKLGNKIAAIGDVELIKGKTIFIRAHDSCADGYKIFIVDPETGLMEAGNLKYKAPVADR